VSLVTPFSVVAPQTDHSLEGPLLRRRLFDHGVAMHLSITLEELGTGGVRGATEYEEPFELACDGVVLVTQRRSDDGLYHTLAATPGLPVYRIGDCVSPRQTADAIFDGHRIGREIERDDPALPAPTLAER
jgi:dimethylamine/trimethylamine dehydrogenase